MFAGLSRRALGLIVLLALMAAVLYVAAPRVSLPEDCLAAGKALEAGDYDGAIELYILCIDMGELNQAQQASAYYDLANAYFAKGNYYQAIRDFGTAIELNPKHGWAYNNRCWSYALLRRAEEALRDCDEALRLLPKRPEVLDSRALAHWLAGEHDRARQDLERAREIDPAMPDWETRFAQFEALF